MLALVLGTAADAHPMGTLSTNRSAIVGVGPDAAWVDYTVDFAEVPSVAEAARLAAGPERYADERAAELLPGIHLAVDGAERALAPEGCEASTGTGEGGLETVLLSCRLRADPVLAGTLELRDDNFAGSPGWREVRFVGDGLPIGHGDPDGVVASGPPLPFRTPPEQMTLARARAVIGAEGTGSASTPAPPPRATDGFASLVGGTLSARFVGLALLSALGLGAGHALSPGHGKTLVAAYLVGSRGTVLQAVLLGLVVTLTHVSSVLGLGVVTLYLSQYVVASALYPWIGVASGLGVVAIGLGLLRARVLPHEHVVREASGEPVGLGRLLALGATGGAVPCPSALVVLLSAVGLHRLAFGLVLILAFSVGLALVLVAIGVLVVRAQGVLQRLSAVSRLGDRVPVVSALVVVALGLAIAWQSAAGAL